VEIEYKSKYIGPFDGKYIGFYKNNLKKWEVNYKNNKKNGPQKVWNENGDIERVVNYLNGKKDGNASFWNINGKKIQQIPYKNDLKNGEEIIWTCGLKATFNWLKGELFGKETWYYKNGNKELEINWKYGVENGKEIHWKESGKKKYELYYTDGIVTSGFLYDSKNKRRKITHFKKDYKIGLYKKLLI